ncbi:MAG TPA: thrombospondin type 3 repeat-containing protein [Gemmatimonadales bacterium]|nr:thrombospondin type 3 repeat-containing protein [Gemmatimonadales bacterium]
MRRYHQFAVFLLGSLTAPLQAQRLYRFEVGVSGGYNVYASELELSSALGATLRAGYWIHGPLSVEADATFVQPKTTGVPQTSVSASSVSLWGLGNFPIGTVSTFFIKGGVGHVSYGSCPKVSVAGAGPCGGAGILQAGAGVRLPIRPTIFMRYEASMNRSMGSTNVSNFTVQAGVSVMLKSEPLKDSDGDGVYDRYDLCPNTPLGALVDKHGCPTDQDGDGVPDGIDRCPNTPPGAIVDAVGCPMDSDGDGVIDGLDKCPDTPKGALVDDVGCPIDSDQDGVPDGIDRCPLTPRGAVVDSMGCPIDTDGDGVPDGLDKCPNTPPGTPVDADGCPTGPGIAAVDTLATELHYTLPGTVWRLRSAKLEPESYPVLDSIVAVMEATPAATAEVNGYAQDRLVPIDNTRLSKERAEAVRDYLVKKGIEVSRITVFGRGSTVLVVPDTTEAARTTNRRVEIRVIRSP